MELGDYFLEFDRTGFPLVRRRTWGFFISLMPITVAQVEIFVNNCGKTGKSTCNIAWYLQVLNEKTQCSQRELESQPWKYFVRGLKPEQLEEFFAFQGNQYRLPTVNEWKILLSDTANIKRLSSNFINAIQAHPGCERSVDVLLRKKMYPLTVPNPEDLLCDSEGLLECVTKDRTVCGIGQPWQLLWENYFAPDEERKFPAIWGEKFCQAVGFRMARYI